MNVEYRNELPEKLSFYELFESTGWNKTANLTPDELFFALHHSWYSISAYHSDYLIGFGRILSDGILHALIVEMIIHPDYQGQGIGSYIMLDMLEKCRAAKIRDIQLFCARGKADGV